MTLHQIRLFLAVCDHGSLSEAAQAFHISQPSFSVIIKQLEDEFGVELFTRYKKRLVLTEEGKLFREKADKILSETESCENYMRDLGKHVPKIQFGISALSSLDFYPDYVIPFREEYPAIQVETHEMSGEDSAAQILNGQINLAIVNKYAVAALPDIEFIPLDKSKIVGCVRKDNPFAYRNDVLPEELFGSRLIFTGEKSYTTRYITKAIRNTGREPEIFMFSHQFLLLLQIIEKYDAVGFFFDKLVSRYKDYAPFYFKDPMVYSRGIAYKKSSTLLKSEKIFVDYCKEHCELSKNLPLELPE